MATNAFRGTLLLLQNRTRRDPESYREEFLAQLDHFKASSATITSQQVANPQYMAVLSYLCHVSHCFPGEGGVVAKIVLELLRNSTGLALPGELRTALVKAMMLLRSKDIVSADETFPILFTLLQERDKSMRKMILSHIVSDIRKVNLPGAKNGATVNKRAQNFLFSVMAEDDPVQARCAEMVLIDLYRRNVWCDERTVEVMTKACFSRHTSIIRTALRFFLMQMPKISSVDDDDSDEDEKPDPGRSISKLKQKLKIVKKTAKRDRILKRNVRSIKRKYNKTEQEEETLAKQHVDPIRLLRDPQQFVERLLAKLQKTSERFEVRILYLNVIARAVSEHEVIHLPLYAFLERYMEPSQLHATQLLALSAMCVHRMVPPDAVEPLVKAIANHFVSDRSSPDAITVGLNTIREICKRQPLAMTEDLLKDLVEYKNQRGDKGVVMASRALIQLYRDVYPELLPAKLRGSKSGAADETRKPVYGAEQVYTDVPGLELLYQAAQDEESRSSGDDDDDSSTSSDGSDDSDDSSSGEWITDSDSEVDPDDVDGEFVDVTDSDSDEEDEDVDSDECPQLVPVASSRTTREDAAATAVGNTKKDNEETSPSRKRPRSDSDSDDEEDEEDGGSESDESSEEDMSDGSDEEVDGEEDEESNDEEDSSGGEGDWDLADDDEEDEEYEEAEEEEEEEENEEEPTLAGALAKATTSSKRAPGGEHGWYEAVDGNDGETAPQTRSPAPSVTSSKASNVSAASSRVLTDADFEKIRKLQEQYGSHQSLRGKKKERDARSKRKYDLIHGISGDLSAHDIEHFTEKKRESDKVEKIERARELRKASSKFEVQKKKKSKLNSTHGEHAKRGKLFQMSKRSARVATKLRSSVADRAHRAKEMKKKDIKFRIKRGWKA